MTAPPRELFPGPKPQYDGPRPEPNGLGGWLALFFFGQVVGLIFGGIGIAYPFSSDFHSDWIASPHWPIYRSALVASSIHSWLLGVGGVLGIAMFVRRDPRCPRYYRVFLLSLAVVGLANLLGSYFGFTEIIRDAGDIMVGAKRVSELRSQDLTLNGRGVMVALLWYQYWIKSVRVANTFPVSDPDVVV